MSTVLDPPTKPIVVEFIDTTMAGREVSKTDATPIEARGQLAWPQMFRRNPIDVTTSVDQIAPVLRSDDGKKLLVDDHFSARQSDVVEDYSGISILKHVRTQLFTIEVDLTKLENYRPKVRLDDQELSSLENYDD